MFGNRSDLLENISFSKRLLPDAKSVLLVTKPAAVLRVLSTARAQWSDVDAHVSCPPIRFPHEVSNVVGVLGVIDEMVGDIQRIQEYCHVAHLECGREDDMAVGRGTRCFRCMRGMKAMAIPGRCRYFGASCSGI